MPLIRITTRNGRPVPEGAVTDLDAALRAALSGTGPVVIMVHGYKYQPGSTDHCPHDSIFSQNPRQGDPRIISWPRRLGIHGTRRDEALGISFGWPARGSIWQAHDKALEAGQALAQLLVTLRHITPARRVHVIAHSLGARVALNALSRGAAHLIDTAILLAGAEFGSAARSALTSLSGRTCQVLHVTSRENDLFDFMMERLIQPPIHGDRMISHSPLRLPNLTTVQLDDPRALAAVRRLGYRIAEPDRRICHWSPYTRPGVFPFYRAVLDGRVALADLAASLPVETAPRWSRLLPIPRLTLPLSFVQKPSV